jgi:hypothetical protein
LLCNVKPDVVEIKLGACATRAISGAQPGQQEGGRVRAPSLRWQAAACSPA